MNKTPSKKILITPSFFKYLEVNYYNTLSKFLETYSYKDLGSLGVEFNNLVDYDENFIEDVQYEYFTEYKNNSGN